MNIGGVAIVATFDISPSYEIVGMNLTAISGSLILFVLGKFS